MRRIQQADFPSHLVAVAGLLVFSPNRVEDGDNVGRTVCKIGCASNWRLMDVHGVRILKDREAARYVHTVIWLMPPCQNGKKGNLK